MAQVQETLWVCTDCLLLAVNDDDSGARPGGREEYEAGMARLFADRYGSVVTYDTCDYPADHEADEDGHCDTCGHDAFMRQPCDLCGTPLAGERARMAVLVP